MGFAALYPSYALLCGGHIRSLMCVIARSDSDDYSAVARRAKVEAIHLPACGAMDCFAALAMTAGRDKLARRVTQFGFADIVSSPEIKNISLYQKGKSVIESARLTRQRGARDRHERAVGCGGRGGADNERR